MVEEWKQIQGWEGKYSVSNTGYVRNDKRGTVLKPMMTGSKRPGAPRAKVRFSTHPRIDFDVSHLVLTAFVSPRPLQHHAMHLDDNAQNNRLDNLRWGTRNDNVQDMVFKCRGGNQRISLETAKEIVELRRSGVKGAQIAKLFGVSQQRVCDIYKGRTSFVDHI